jgi:hypothetical protein
VPIHVRPYASLSPSPAGVTRQRPAGIQGQVLSVRRADAARRSHTGVVPARAGRPHKMSAPGGAVKPEMAGGARRPSAVFPMHGSSGGVMNGRREEFHGCMSEVYRPVQGQTRTKPLRGEQARGQYSRPASNPKAPPRFFARETKSPRQPYRIPQPD